MEPIVITSSPVSLSFSKISVTPNDRNLTTHVAENVSFSSTRIATPRRIEISSNNEREILKIINPADKNIAISNKYHKMAANFSLLIDEEIAFKTENGHYSDLLNSITKTPLNFDENSEKPKDPPFSLVISRLKISQTIELIPNASNDIDNKTPSPVRIFYFPYETVWPLFENESFIDFSNAILQYSSEKELERIVFIFEGFNKGKRERISKQLCALQVSIALKAIADAKFSILYSNGLSDTAKLIVQLMKSLAHLQVEKSSGIFSSSICLKSIKQQVKRMQIDKYENESSNAFAKMLIQIPHVSENIADAIISKFPNIFCLYQKYQMTPTVVCCEKLLEEIPIPGNSGTKVRRLGPALSKRIYNCLMGSEGDLPAMTSQE